ncbi:hypothetical protein SAMN04488564_105549 [Lentzea waywayandensis]|uniref:Uncharacterized protein n=1 Tax=Lentzea waywayandensis TaxID=84724 RepID=A0A1I6EUN5_9PSEU|nr:hypothetical protein [Lentzea waywayandensis]SFR21301.1 hypothetical protein SAMN04488564_105549 [Lentzea waywayandensis]
MDALDRLYRSLDARMRPEDVATLVREAQPSLTEAEHRVIGEVALHARRWHGFSGMSDDYARPVGAARQVAATRVVFGVDGAVDADDPLSVLEFASLVGAEIAWDPDRTDFLSDRLNRDERAAAGIGLSKRQYNRRFRMLRRLSAKADRLDRVIVTRDVTLLAAAGFVGTIDRDRFRADVNAACFIAYYTARRKLRRRFTLLGRDNAFDQVAAALLRRCRLAAGTDWAMIALAHPTEEVLGHLTPEQLGNQIGRWSAATRSAAAVLGDLWQENDFEQANMVVRRGHDSSTWNTFARAYNAARAGWISSLHAAGAADLLADAWPGKAMRLMAADLAWWHRDTGGDLHSDTDVWAALPLPWEVLDGTATCTRGDVERACRSFDMDPARSGWSAPRAHGATARFRPTPELVHGVAVADPVWGMALRRAGVYSGKAPVSPVFGGQDAAG